MARTASTRTAGTRSRRRGSKHSTISSHRASLIGVVVVKRGSQVHKAIRWVGIRHQAHSLELCFIAKACHHAANNLARTQARRLVLGNAALQQVLQHHIMKMKGLRVRGEEPGA